MEEIWNYGCTHGDGKVFLGVWGSGVLEYDTAAGTWKDYLDPDGEMEIDLYRDDGIDYLVMDCYLISKDLNILKRRESRMVDLINN